MPAAPGGQSIFGGSTIKFSVPEETKDQASDSVLAEQTFSGFSGINFPTPVAKKDEARQAIKPKPTFGGVSTFSFPEPVAKNDDDIGKPKPTFGGVSTFSFPEPVAKNDGDIGRSKPTFGGVSIFNIPEPAGKNNGDTGKPKPTFGGVSTFNIPEPVAKNDEAGKPQPTFGGVPASSIFVQKDNVEKAAEEKPANPFAGVFGSKYATTPAATPAKPSTTSSTPVPVGGALFGNLPSTASGGLFGSEAKIGETKKVDGIFPSTTSGSLAPATEVLSNKPEESPRPVSGGIFGAKAPISLSAPSTTSEVNYPALPPAPATSTASPVTTNGNTALIQFNQAPPPSEHLTEAQREEFDRQYKVRILNSTFVHALQDVDVNTADLRVVFREYERLYEHIMHGTKRKDESQANGTASSPKRPKTDEPKPAASSAASVFGAIVDKNIGQPTISTAKESQPKSVFGGFNCECRAPVN